VLKEKMANLSEKFEQQHDDHKNEDVNFERDKKLESVQI
jgi:hypothetical protein